jgi:hypothetical protein
MKKTGNIFTFIVLMAVIAAATRYFYSGFQLKQYGSTTFGVIDHLNIDDRNGVEVAYYFWIDGKMYNGKATRNDSIHFKPGDTIRVKYSTRNPELNKVDE